MEGKLDTNLNEPHLYCHYAGAYTLVIVVPN